MLVILGLAVGSVKVVHVVVQGYHALLKVVCGNKRGKSGVTAKTIIDCQGVEAETRGSFP